MAEVVKNKFGTLIGWNKLTAHTMGRDLEGIKKVAYSDTVKLENAYGANKYPVGREEGNYECEASIELYQEEVRALLLSLKPGQRLQDIPEFDIICEYEGPGGLRYRDRINNCRFTNNSIDVKQGDGSISTEYKLLPSHIDWNTI